MDGRLKYPIETRIEAAKLFDAGFGFKAVATRLALPLATATLWRDKHSQQTLLRLNTVANKQYSAALKIAAVEKHLAGATITNVVAEFNISTRALFQKWVATYREDGPEGLMPKTRGRPRKPQVSLESETLEQKVARLEFENEALKKLQALVALEQQRNSKR